MSMKLSAAAAGVILLAGAVGAIAEDVILVPEQETTIRDGGERHAFGEIGSLLLCHRSLLLRSAARGW